MKCVAAKMDRSGTFQGSVLKCLKYQHGDPNAHAITRESIIVRWFAQIINGPSRFKQTLRYSRRKPRRFSMR
jgi:hypothetical protein